MAASPIERVPDPILTLSKSIIRPLCTRDAASLAQAANNPNIARFMRNIFPQPYTLADAEWWIDRCSKSKPLYDYALVHPTTGFVMGGIGLKPGDDVQSRTAEVGYWLGEEHFGKGIMSEAVPAFVDWAFRQFDGPEGLVRIWAGIFEANKASECVLKNAGFVFEGTLRKGLCKNGVLMDQLLYSVIREDWERGNKITGRV